MLFNLFRTLLPLALLAAAAAFAWQLMQNRPEATRMERPRPRVAVEALEARPDRYTITVRSQGTVQPRRTSQLVAEVSGVVREVSDSLRNGGFFRKGDVLVRIDATNYELALTSAKARVAEAKAALTQEEAEARVLAEDWQKLGRKAPPLGLREPQIAAARATLASAEADVERARVDLARTTIRAPYDGRARSLAVDLGQFVSVGMTAATIQGVDALEVRLPVTAADSLHLALPDPFLAQGAQPVVGPSVTLTARLGEQRYRWEAKVTRVEATIDEASRQLYLVAEVRDPYRPREDGTPPLRVGQFVEAAVAGETLEGVFVLPRVALRERDQVLVIGPERTLSRRSVHVAWSSREAVVVNRGLSAGELVSLTQPDVVTEGMPVDARIDGIPLEKLDADGLSVRVSEPSAAPL